MIAIALACNPKILIADEPTTALDVTIQAQILELMRDLQNEIGTAIILITHDLGVVANAASRVAVMYGGKIVETGTVDEISIIQDIPIRGDYWGRCRKWRPRGGAASYPGSPPDLADPPKGCPFVTRCPYAMKACKNHMPAYTSLSETQKTACWLLDERAPKVEIPASAVVGGVTIHV